MIKKMDTYTCICDNCKADLLEDLEFTGYDEDSLKEIIGESDWIEKDGNHYCFYCYGYDDNDEIFIITERKKDIEKTL
jgi:hypothetical protein